MSSAAARPGSNPTRAQLRLVMLGQWVRAGLALARGGATGRGLFGAAVALWQVVQAVRLAMALIQRLSELRDALSTAAPATTSGEADAQAFALDNRPTNADALSHALSEMVWTIRDALGLAPGPRVSSGPARRAIQPGSPAAGPGPRRRVRLQPPPGWPPGSRRRRWRSAPAARQTTLTPIVA